jgi:hypothetical protein
VFGDGNATRDAKLFVVWGPSSVLPLRCHHAQIKYRAGKAYVKAVGDSAAITQMDIPVGNDGALLSCFMTNALTAHS